MQKLLESVYTPEREQKIESLRLKYNEALEIGNTKLAKFYGEEITKQLSADWVKLYVEPTGMLKKEGKRKC